MVGGLLYWRGFTAYWPWPLRVRQGLLRPPLEAVAAGSVCTQRTHGGGSASADCSRPRHPRNRLQPRGDGRTRGGGNWVINKRPFDPDRDDATPKLGQVERWIFQNDGGGWTHPIHVHLEAMQIQSINGRAPDLIQSFKRDSVNLGPNGQAEMLTRFRTFPGRYVFHCHNIEHEDMRMMSAFQVLR